MIVNVRIRKTREYRRLKSNELARQAGISPGALSLIEKRLRTPRIDTLQKLAAALEVSTSYLLGEEDDKLPLPHGLARQSLKIFLRENEISQGYREYLEKVSNRDSAPQTVKGWCDLLANLAVYQSK